MLVVDADEEAKPRKLIHVLLLLLLLLLLFAGPLLLSCFTGHAEEDDDDEDDELSSLTGQLMATPQSLEVVPDHSTFVS